MDPFFVPTTEEEREEFGEEGQGVGAPNLARRLIDSGTAVRFVPCICLFFLVGRPTWRAASSTLVLGFLASPHCL